MCIRDRSNAMKCDGCAHSSGKPAFESTAENVSCPISDERVSTNLRITRTGKAVSVIEYSLGKPALENVHPFEQNPSFYRAIKTRRYQPAC